MPEQRAFSQVLGTLKPTENFFVSTATIQAALVVALFISTAFIEAEWQEALWIRRPSTHLRKIELVMLVITNGLAMLFQQLVYIGKFLIALVPIAASFFGIFTALNALNDASSRTHHAGYLVYQSLAYTIAAVGVVFVDSATRKLRRQDRALALAVIIGEIAAFILTVLWLRGNVIPGPYRG